jgi:addiction module RelE/StbE family toxin
MQYLSSKKFDKQLKKLPQKTKKHFYEKMMIFQTDPFHPVLNNHSVHYPYEGCRSINITGDFRALYEMIGDTVLFIRVGTHSELYK